MAVLVDIVIEGLGNTYGYDYLYIRNGDSLLTKSVYKYQYIVVALPSFRARKQVNSNVLPRTIRDGKRVEQAGLLVSPSFASVVFGAVLNKASSVYN